jgi:hypothetical protein
MSITDQKDYRTVADSEYRYFFTDPTMYEFARFFRTEAERDEAVMQRLAEQDRETDQGLSSVFCGVVTHRMVVDRIETRPLRTCNHTWERYVDGCESCEALETWDSEHGDADSMLYYEMLDINIVAPVRPIWSSQ